MTEEPDAATARPERRRRVSFWQETLLLLGGALVLALTLKTFFVQSFYIPSASMEPGLIKNDRILVEKTSYWFGDEPQRGDVVVFRDPGGWLGPAQADDINAVGRALKAIGLYPSGGHLVKRVIGVEGDVIRCCDDAGRLMVNGQALDEDSYVAADRTARCRGPQIRTCDWTAGPIPEGSLFVMGDNRQESEDSSAHLCTKDETGCTEDPFVPVDNVVGRVFLLVWPASRLDQPSRPSTFADVPDPANPPS